MTSYLSMLKSLKINRGIKTKLASHMESYFNDQRLRQANRSQSEVRSISNDLSSIAIEKSNKALWAKRKEFKDRSEYFKIYRRKCRQNSAFKAKESVYQKESKQTARKDPVFKTKERESKQSARQNPVTRAKESMYQKQSK